MEGEFFILCGRTCQWKLCRGACLFRDGTENVKHCASLGWSKMFKKQPLTSMTANLQSHGSTECKGRQSYRGPISSMTLLIVLRSCKSHQLSLPGFLITKTGVFQGLLVGTMWHLDNCSWMRDSSAFSFSAERGHWSTHWLVSLPDQLWSHTLYSDPNYKSHGREGISSLTPHWDNRSLLHKVMSDHGYPALRSSIRIVCSSWRWQLLQS